MTIVAFSAKIRLYRILAETEVPMQYIKRDMESLILELSKEYSCILISGPRQVGKTTMLEHIKPSNMQVVTLDDLSERQLAKSDPEMFLSLHPTPLMIDEVQYAPELFSYIKIAIDKGAAPGSFWLTGSQAFKLMTLAQESLAGRVALLHLSSLSQHELYGKGSLQPFSVSADKLMERQTKSEKADINQIYERIWKGSLPGYAGGKFSNRNVFYASYLQTYIDRDVREVIEGIDSTRFADFIRAAACRAGQMLNIHSIAVDVGVSDETAKRWLAVLEKSDIIFYLYPYSNNLLKRTIKTPKMYFFDTGLVSYLTRYSSAEILMNGAINGAILENYVVSEIRKNYLNLGSECLLYYYRDKDDKEIDLCIEIDGKLHPIEIKRSSIPQKSMISSFDVLKKSSIPIGTGAVVCIKENVLALDKETLMIPVWLI